MDKVTRQCPQTTTFLNRIESRSGFEPRSFRLPALCLTARPNQLTSGCGSGLYIYTSRKPLAGYRRDGEGDYRGEGREGGRW